MDIPGLIKALKPASLDKGPSTQSAPSINIVDNDKTLTAPGNCFGGDTNNMHMNGMGIPGLGMPSMVMQSPMPVSGATVIESAPVQGVPMQGVPMQSMTVVQMPSAMGMPVM